MAPSHRNRGVHASGPVRPRIGIPIGKRPSASAPIRSERSASSQLTETAAMTNGNAPSTMLEVLDRAQVR